MGQWRKSRWGDDILSIVWKAESVQTAEDGGRDYFRTEETLMEIS